MLSVRTKPDTPGQVETIYFCVITDRSAIQLQREAEVVTGSDEKGNLTASLKLCKPNKVTISCLNSNFIQYEVTARTLFSR